MSLPECLERAAAALPALADQIRPANGDPHRLIDLLRPDDAARVLCFVLGQDEAASEELLDVWAGMEQGASVLLAVPEAEVPKAGRKLLRRALHRLRARGVAVAEAQAGAPAPVVARRAMPAADRWQVAHVSAPDFRGTRMAYLVEDHPAGGARLFEIRFDPERGILDCKLYNAGRSKVRGFLKSLVAGAQQRLFEVDHEALCALVRRASLAQPADRPLPGFFVEWRGRLFSDALEKQATPGEQARDALGTAADPGASRAAVEAAIREGRIGPWPPSTTWVSERMERIQKQVGELASEARAAAIEDFLNEVAGELAGATNPSSLAEQLGEWAWIEWQREDLERARALLAVAAELAGPGSADRSRALARARVDALYGPFLEAMKKVENDPR